MLRAFAVALFVVGTLATAPAQVLRSVTLTKQLTAAMSEQKLEAIAARDPDEADRFVAALLFPDAQLLVVSARYGSPLLLQARLAHKQYRDVYLDLQSAPVRDSSWFFQDMKADGLCSERDQVADVVYTGGKAPTIFDGDWKKHGLSEKAYEEMLSGADDRYSRLLSILLTELKGA
jgi:hypothetical protein